MPSLARILPSKADYPRLAVWIFGAAWLLGNVGLMVGLGGLWGEWPGTCLFVIACITWWGAFRLGGMKRRAGIVVGLLALTVWTLSLVSFIVYAFHDYVADFFFWAATAALTLLAAAAVRFRNQSSRRPESRPEP